MLQLYYIFWFCQQKNGQNFIDLSKTKIVIYNIHIKTNTIGDKMQYKYCNNQNFEDFASGRVILQKPGFPNFPVRLSQEIFCRSLSYLKTKSNIQLYDPCCGSAYMSTAIGLLNFKLIEKIICSDINSEVLNTAKENLKLLSICGLNERIAQLQSLYHQFNKEAHLQAIQSANTLINLICKEKNITTTTFEANILSSNVLESKNFKADIILTDVPYDNLVAWQSENEANKLLDNLLPILKSDSVVAICSNKRQKFNSNNYVRLEKQQVGKRKFEIFTPR